MTLLQQENVSQLVLNHLGSTGGDIQNVLQRRWRYERLGSASTPSMSLGVICLCAVGLVDNLRQVTRHKKYPGVRDHACIRPACYLCSTVDLCSSTGHFWNIFAFFFKPRPSAQHFIWNWSSIYMEMKLVFIWKVVYQASLWKRGCVPGLALKERLYTRPRFEREAVYQASLRLAFCKLLLLSNLRC